MSLRTTGPPVGRGLLLAVAYVMLSGCLRPALAQLADPLFDRYEVETGLAKRQTVLTGFLLGGVVSELAVLNIDEHDNRRLRIYALDDGTWLESRDATLRPEVLFVDVAKVGGRDRVIVYERSHPASLSSLGRLSWFDPESGTASELVVVASSFQPPRADEIPHVDVTRDVNGDGRDDLVVPDERGFWVFIQTDGGTFADPVMLGPPTDMSGILGADGYRYAPWSVGRIYEVDIDLDGRRDLAFWNEDHFEAHLQDERGMFSDVTESYVTEVEFDSDDVLFLASEDMTGRVLHSLADLNVDGTADLVVLSLEGRRNSQKRSVFEVYFGEPSEDGGLVFAGKVGAAFRSKGRIQLGMDPHVLRGDGQVALMFTTLENRFLGGNLWKRIKGAMGDDVWLELEFHQTVGGVYRNEPNATYRIALDGVPSHREPGSVPLDIALRGRTHESRRTRESWLRAFNRTLLIGDVTGDGRSDLLIEAEFQDLHVHVGVAGPELFAAKPQKVKVTLFDEEYIWLVDLNGDGKQDILQHHPFTLTTPHGAAKQPPGTEPHRVTTLIAR